MKINYILLVTEENDPTRDSKSVPFEVHEINRSLQNEGFLRVDHRSGHGINTSMGCSVFLFAVDTMPWIAKIEGREFDERREHDENATLQGMARLITDQDWPDEEGVALVVLTEDDLTFTTYQYNQLEDLLE